MAELVRSDPGRKSAVIDQRGHGLAEAVRRPNARKVVDRIAPRLEAFAAVVAQLDPGEVNGEELPSLAVVAESLGVLGKFVDAVKPTRG